MIDCRDGISVVYKAINDLIIFIAGSDECDELLCKYPLSLEEDSVCVLGV
jgi:hypothetical protein